MPRPQLWLWKSNQSRCCCFCCFCCCCRWCFTIILPIVTCRCASLSVLISCNNEISSVQFVSCKWISCSLKCTDRFLIQQLLFSFHLFESINKCRFHTEFIYIFLFYSCWLNHINFFPSEEKNVANFIDSCSSYRKWKLYQEKWYVLKSFSFSCVFQNCVEFEERKKAPVAWWAFMFRMQKNSTNNK